MRLTSVETAVDLLESKTHSFIVKIWLEQTAEENGRAIWRGHITHAFTGERRYLKELNDILVFIAPYLEKMGVKLGVWWRVRQLYFLLSQALAPGAVKKG